MADATAPSIFDPNLIMGSQSTEALSTRGIPIPVGEYLAQIMELVPRNVQGRKDTTKFYSFLDMELEIKLTEEAAKILGRETTRLTHSVSLDLTAQGNLDYSKGKNLGLGRVREAAGQNVPGQAWNPMMLKGAVIKVKTKQEPAENDPETVYSKIDKVGSPAAATPL